MLSYASWQVGIVTIAASVADVGTPSDMEMPSAIYRVADGSEGWSYAQGMSWKYPAAGIRSNVIAFFCFVCLVPSLSLAADDAEIQRLIEQLASDSYTTRQLARERLISLTESDLQTSLLVEQKLQQRNAIEGELEFDLARQRLRQLISGRRQKRLLDSFLFAPNAGEELLPGWSKFRQLVGDDFDARRMFVSILERDRSFGERLLAPVSEQSDSLPRDIDRYNLQSWSAMLALQSSRAGHVPDRLANGIVTMLRSEGQGPIPRLEYEQKVFGRLLERFFCCSTVDLQDRVLIGVRYDCDRIVETDCRRILSDSGQTPARIAVALLALSAAEFNPSQLDRWVDQYLADDRVAYVWRAVNPRRKTLRTQVRDIALVVKLSRQGVDPRTYGFTSLLAHPDLRYQPHSLGFETQQEREATFQRQAEIRLR